MLAVAAYLQHEKTAPKSVQCPCSQNPHYFLRARLVDSAVGADFLRHLYQQNDYELPEIVVPVYLFGLRLLPLCSGYLHLLKLLLVKPFVDSDNLAEWNSSENNSESLFLLLSDVGKISGLLIVVLKKLAITVFNLATRALQLASTLVFLSLGFFSRDSSANNRT